MVGENESCKKVIGGTGITPGGNVTFGNVSGQVAIGENITQIINQDGTKSWLYTQGFRPSIDPDNIFGRQEELEEIDEFLKQNSALAITGFRGTGKSTLASMYTDRVQQKGEFAGIYWRKVDETIDISDVVGSFFTVIGKPIQDLGRYKVEELIYFLFKELNTASYFLVLDNFETLLDPITNKSIKAGFSDFIENATQSMGKSRVLFTSWECPVSERGIRPKYHTIGGLDASSAVQLLRSKGLKEPDDELKKAIELCGGHPLALLLLVQLVEGEEETFSSILKDNTLWIGEGGEVAENILDKVYNERLKEEERKLLQYLSLYRIPVPLQAIVIAANDSTWTVAKVKKMAISLKRKSLLQKDEEYYWEEALIDNYAYNKLADKIEVHKRAYEYYLSLPLPETRTKKEDFLSLIEAHYHACMSKEYDKAASIIFDSNLNENLITWGNFELLVDLYLKIIPKDPFHDSPLLSNIINHSIIMGHLGEAYQAIGEVRKALEFFKYSLMIYQVTGNKLSQGNMLGNIGGVYQVLGEVRKAIEYHKKDLNITLEIGDKNGEGSSLNNLGCAYQALGEVEKAIVYYEKALEVAHEIGNKSIEGGCFGNLGCSYQILGEIRKAIEYHKNALKIVQETKNKPKECLCLASLGTCYETLGEIRKAIEYHENALKIAQEIGLKSIENGSNGQLGVIYKNRGDFAKAIEYLKKALDISQEIEDRHGEGMWLGNLGLTYCIYKEVNKGIEYLEKALNIAEEIGDRINKGVWLGNIGLAYYDLGETKRAVAYYVKALKISQEVGDKHNEGIWINNIGNYLEKDNQHKKALACYFLAKDIRIKIEDPYLIKTNFDIKKNKEYFGDKKFENITKKIEPKLNEIMNLILEEFQIECNTGYS